MKSHSCQSECRAGFLAWLRAVRDGGVPAISHNLVPDLPFRLHAFAGLLPARLARAQGAGSGSSSGGTYSRTSHLAIQPPEVQFALHKS